MPSPPSAGTPEPPVLSGWDTRGEPRCWRRSVLTAAGGRARSPGAWRQRGRCCGAAAAALTRSRIAARGREEKGRGSDRRCHRPAPPRSAARCGTRPSRAAAAPSPGRGRQESGGARQSGKRTAKSKERWEREEEKGRGWGEGRKGKSKSGRGREQVNGKGKK